MDAILNIWEKSDLQCGMEMILRCWDWASSLQASVAPWDSPVSSPWWVWDTLESSSHCWDSHRQLLGEAGGVANLLFTLACSPSYLISRETRLKYVDQDEVFCTEWKNKGIKTMNRLRKGVAGSPAWGDEPPTGRHGCARVGQRLARVERPWQRRLHS